MNKLFILFLFCAAFSVVFAEPIAIIGAMDSEIEYLLTKVTEKQTENVSGLNFTRGRLDGKTVVICKSGVGKVNAAMTTSLLIHNFNPTEVIFTGIAGGLNPGIFPGDVIICEKTVQHDLGEWTDSVIIRDNVRNPITGADNPTFFKCDSALFLLAKKVSKELHFEAIEYNDENRIPQVHEGIIATGDCFLSSGIKKQELISELSADAVEMEGAAVAQVCYQLEVPFLLIRSISDRADENAISDLRKFYKIAARNSADLVIAIVKNIE